MTSTTRFGANLRAYSAVYWGLVLGTTPLAGFASVLHRHTHHRPLGAVTFVVGASALLFVAVLVARRCKESGGGVWLTCRAAALASALLPVLAMLVGR